MKRSLCVVVFYFVAFAQSQPPSPTPPKASHDQQSTKDTKSDERKTPDKAITPPLIGEPHSDQNGSKKASDSPSDWWLIIPTTAIAGAAAVQVWIYCRQADYMRRGLRISIRQTRIATRGLSQTKNAIRIAVHSANIASDNATTAEKTLEAIKSQVRLAQESVEATRRAAEATAIGAEAAKQSADAANRNIDLMIAKERARLKIRVQVVSTEVPLERQLFWTVTNNGNSKAFIDYAQSRAFFLRGDDMPDVSGSSLQNTALYSDPIKPDEQRTELAVVLPHFGVAVESDIREGRVTLHFYALVKYQDAFGSYYTKVLRKLQPIPLWAAQTPGLTEWQSEGHPEDNQET